MSQLFCVSYELDYSHRVAVGIEADHQDQAVAKAQIAFDEGVIWDDTPDMPLLYDDYEEVGDNTLVFEAEAVEAWPKPDISVVIAKVREYAVKACDALIAGDLDEARRWAENVALVRQEFRKTSEPPQPDATESQAGHEGKAILPVQEGGTANHGEDALSRFDVHLYPVMRLKINMIEAKSPTEAIQQAISQVSYFNGIGIWPYNMEFAEDFDGFVVDDRGEVDAKASVPMKSYSYEKDGVTQTGDNTKEVANQPARLVVSLEGGLVQAVFADTAQPLQCAVFDLDTEGADSDEMAVLPNGTEFLGHIEPVTPKAGFVADVFKSLQVFEGIQG